jgi:lactoylglutathione lyase
MTTDESARLTYVIRFVSDMTEAVAFYRDVLGLPLKFESPYWSEFATGATSLALHPSSAANPAGTMQLGFGVPDLRAFHARLSAAGVVFTQPPTHEEGRLLARFLDPQGKEISVGELLSAS